MLKVIKRLFAGIFLSLLILGSKEAALEAKAANLDYIREYTVWVSPYDDGSLELTYHLE